MNAVMEEEVHTVQDNEEYEVANDETVMKISTRLIEKHMEAYKALANA